MSDPSSSSTSPASAYKQSSEHHYGTAHAKRPSQTAAFSAAQPLSATLAHFSSEPRAFTTSSYSPRDHFARHSPMNPPSSSTYESLGPRSFQRAGSSSNIATDHSPQSSKGLPYAESPDNSRGPAPKARRTSPGGSRASANLAATQPPPQQRSEDLHHHYGAGTLAQTGTPRSPSFTNGTPSRTQPSSSTSTMHPTASPATAGWGAGGITSGVANPHSADGSSGTYNGWHTSSQTHQDSMSIPQSTNTAMLSPRTRAGDEQPSTFGTHASHVASSPRPSQSSQTGRSETHNGSKPSLLPKMDLATFPPQELLKILATLLHEIATANDEFQPDGSKDESARSKRAARSRDRSAPATPAESADTGDASALRNYASPPGSHLSFNDSRRPSVTTAALGALATPSSTLCFHARNVPSISIESYLLRILKYCPTTNEVFLSLLVYFDRMSRMGSGAKPGANGDGEVAGEAAGLPRAMERAAGHSDMGQDASARQCDTGASGVSANDSKPYTHPGIRGFAIDSYNVHRLVIAGVTVASKFFSDVFYTNSRYAKVGGLPPHELNQLELQFLLLNDFRLTIPLEEMQRYADQLLMYGNGRPEMVKMTKEVSSVAALGSERAGGPSTTTATPVGTTAGGDAADGTSKSSRVIVPSDEVAAPQHSDEAGPTIGPSSGRPEADAQGDVHMSDVQRS